MENEKKFSISIGSIVTFILLIILFVIASLLLYGKLKAPIPGPLGPLGPTEAILTKYKIKSILGKGGFGTVYLIEDEYQKKFALKTISKRNSDESIGREINIMKTLKHPNLTELCDYDEDSEYVNLIMDYMRGGTLQQRLEEKKKLSETTAKFYFIQIGKALEYLHEKGIAHRDMKPDNILLESTDEHSLLKISDFGLSKNQKESDLKTRCGTIKFAAPEYFTQSPPYSTKVDIWALGIILYMCLTGLTPFKCPSEIVNKEVIFDAEDFKACSGDSIELIKKLLNKNPKERPVISLVLNDKWLKE